MFGISFSELLLVGLVALLVLGPERLPGAARTAGLWVGRLKRSFNAIKQEVEREIGADEIRRQLHNEHILSLEEEARKIMQPQQAQPSAAPPVAQPAPHAEHAEPGTLASSEQVIMVETPSLAPSADSAPAATVESAPDPANPQAAAVPSAPSANDSTQPPRAP